MKSKYKVRFNVIVESCLEFDAPSDMTDNEVLEYIDRAGLNKEPSVCRKCSDAIEIIALGDPMEIYRDNEQIWENLEGIINIDKSILDEQEYAEAFAKKIGKKNPA